MYLETRRLTVRHMRDGDYPDWQEYAMDPESCRMRGTRCYETQEEARMAFDWLMIHEKRFYAIELRETGKCVGHLIIYNYPPVSDEPELRGFTGRALSFCVSREYQRRGIATEALSAVIGYLFDRREIDYINSGYLDFNTPSRRLHDKLLFTPFTKTPITLPTGEPATAVETVLFNPHAPRAARPRVSEK